MFFHSNCLQQIYYIQKFDLHKLPEQNYGEFHSGDSYIIDYKFKSNDKETHILYYWLVSTKLLLSELIKKFF